MKISVIPRWRQDRTAVLGAPRPSVLDAGAARP